MKHIYLMATLCVAPTFICVASTTHIDAQAIAHTLQDRLRKSVDPHYLAVRKSLKTTLKTDMGKSKNAMHALQKKLQVECDEMKQKIHADYLASRSIQQQAQHEALLALKTANHSAHKPTSTLALALENAQGYVATLRTQAEMLENCEAFELLEQEESWIKNLEKTAAKAGISFNESPQNKLKKEKKRGRHKKA